MGSTTPRTTASLSANAGPSNHRPSNGQRRGSAVELQGDPRAGRRVVRFTQMSNHWMPTAHIRWVATCGESRRLVRRIVRFFAKPAVRAPKSAEEHADHLKRRRRGRKGGREPFRSRLRALKWRPQSSTASVAERRRRMLARNRKIRRTSRRDSKCFEMWANVRASPVAGSVPLQLPHASSIAPG